MTKFPNLYLCHSWHARWLLKFTSQGLNLEVLLQDSQDASLNTIRPWNLTTKFPNLYLCHNWHARWLPKFASQGLNLEVLSQDASLNTIRPQDSVEELED